MKRFNAFTMTEIMVTLLLIGIVASLILPFFIDEFQKAKWALIYKRSFAETYNALTRLALDEDCSKSLTCTRLFDDGQIISTQKLGDAMTTVMATKLNCGMDNGKCFSHKVKVGLSGTKEENLMETMKNDVNFLVDNFYTFQTLRGVSYAVFSFGMNCLNIANTEQDKELQSGYIDFYVEDAEKETNQMMSLCGFIILDVNGTQKPNVWGRDVFGVWITDRSTLGVYPFGGEYDKRFGNKCNMSSSDDAHDTRGCAAQLIKDGWKMMY